MLEVKNEILGIRSDDGSEWTTILVATPHSVTAKVGGGELVVFHDDKVLYRKSVADEEQALQIIDELTETYNLHAAWEGASLGGKGWMARCETLGLGGEHVALWREILRQGWENTPFQRPHAFCSENLCEIMQEFESFGGINPKGDWRYRLQDCMPLSDEDLDLFMESQIPYGCSDALIQRIQQGYLHAFNPLLTIMEENEIAEAFHSEHPEQGWSWDDDTDRPYEGGQEPPRQENAVIRVFRSILSRFRS